MKDTSFQITYREALLHELTADEQSLYQAALEASSKAYAPYSKFQVGAAALLANGKIVTGSNQENAAYPSGLCAERVALFAAGAAYPDIPVVALAIIAQSGGIIRDMISPCGACCQVLVETEARSMRPMKILLMGREKVRVLASVASLLPFSFSAKELTV